MARLLLIERRFRDRCSFFLFFLFFVSVDGFKMIGTLKVYEMADFKVIHKTIDNSSDLKSVQFEALSTKFKFDLKKMKSLRLNISKNTIVSYTSKKADIILTINKMHEDSIFGIIIINKQKFNFKKRKFIFSENSTDLDGIAEDKFVLFQIVTEWEDFDLEHLLPVQKMTLPRAEKCYLNDTLYNRLAKIVFLLDYCLIERYADTSWVLETKLEVVLQLVSLIFQEQLGIQLVYELHFMSADDHPQINRGECLKRGSNFHYIVNYMHVMYPNLYEKGVLLRILLTTSKFSNVYGVAKKDSLCSERSVIIAKDTEILDFTILHELGHSFGSEHDETANVMVPRLEFKRKSPVFFERKSLTRMCRGINKTMAQDLNETCLKRVERKDKPTKLKAVALGIGLSVSFILVLILGVFIFSPAFFSKRVLLVAE